MSSRLVLPAVLLLALAGLAITALVSRPPASLAAPARPARAEAASPLVARAVAAAPVPGVREVRPADPALPSAPPAAEPATVELWLPVRVVARNGNRRDALPVGDVDVAVGVGNPSSPAAVVLSTGRTGADGIAELEVPWSAVEAARSTAGRIWARPAGVGWMERSRTAALPETLDPVEILIIPVPGFTVRGLLLGEDDAPAPGTVQACGVTAGGEPARGYGRVLSKGWIELHLEREGTYDLIGWSCAAPDAAQPSRVFAGVGVLRAVAVVAADLPRDLTVQLVGDGVLRGRVQGAGGEPVAGLDLSITATRLARAGDASQMLREQFLREGAGGCDAAVRTAADGGFEVRGLRRDLFEIYAPPERPLNRAPIPSDGEPFVLILDLPHLIVRSVDEHGEPRPGQLSPRPSLGRRSADGWPREPCIVVTPTRGALLEAGWDMPETLHFLRGKEVGDGSLFFEVRAGGEYLVGLLGGALAWRPQTVRVPELAGRVEVTLRAGEEVGLGVLSLSVADLAGPVTRNIIVHVEDPDTARPLVSKSTSSRDTWPLELELPVGRYRLAVEGLASTDMCQGSLLQASKHGRFEAEVRVVADQVLPIQALLPAGARIDLDLQGQVEQADLDAIQSLWADHPPEAIAGWAGGARVRLLAQDRWPRQVLFGRELNGDSVLYEHLPLGTRRQSEIVPAGRCLLEVRLPGGRVASTPVVLKDGQTTVVALEL